MCNIFIILDVKFAKTENDPQYEIFIFPLCAGLITSVCGAVDEEDLSWWHFYISVVLTVLTGVAGLLANILSIVTLLSK